VPPSKHAHISNWIGFFYCAITVYWYLKAHWDGLNLPRFGKPHFITLWVKDRGRDCCKTL